MFFITYTNFKVLMHGSGLGAGVHCERGSGFQCRVEPTRTVGQRTPPPRFSLAATPEESGPRAAARPAHTPEQPQAEDVPVSAVTHHSSEGGRRSSFRAVQTVHCYTLLLRNAVVPTVSQSRCMLLEPRFTSRLQIVFLSACLVRVSERV